MTKTILCNEDQKEYLFEEEALKVNDGIKAVQDLRTVSTANFLYPNRKSEKAQMITLAQKLRERKEDFPLYGEMFVFPAFLEEILAFAKECALYGIQEEDLPDNSRNEKELRKIISAALTLDLDEKKLSVNDISERIRSQSGIRILDGFETDYYSYLIRQNLKDLPHLHWRSEKQPERRLRHALNSAREMEAAVQDIISHGADSTIILADSNNLPLLKTVLNRYELPYSCTIDSVHTNINDIFSSLVQFALHPDKEHFFICADRNAFGCHWSKDVRDYLENTMVSCTYPEGILRRFNNCLFAGDASADQHTIQNIDTIDKRASAWYEGIKDSVNRLLHPDLSQYDGLSEYAASAAAAYELIRTSDLYTDQNEYSAARRIGHELEEVLPLIETREDAQLYADALREGSLNHSVLASSHVKVTDLKHPVPVSEYTYVLGCSAAAYPALPVRRGLFDENYTAEINGYPDLARRTDAYRSQLAWIDRSASKAVYYSYSTNDYDGKSIEPSFEVTSLFSRGDDQPWKILENNAEMPSEHILSDPQTREQLFVQNERGQKYVYGSITKVQTWFNCPYQFFLQYGMHMRKRTLPALNGLTIGRIQHSILERLVRKYGKKYAGALKDSIDEMALPYFEALKQVLPVYRDEIDLTYARMCDNLKLKAECFGDYESDSIDFIPFAQETAFDHFFISDHVSIQGKIDRIDADHAHKLFRIIDYKTSALDLNEKDIASGHSLQLLSYLVFAYEDPSVQDEMNNALPAGMLYYPLISVRNDISRTKGKNFKDDVSMHALMLKDNAVHGWSFIDAPELLDGDLSHVKSIKKQHDYRRARDLLNEVYEAFYAHLLSDEGIDVHPAKLSQSKACAFCSFRTICRYHGDGYEPERFSDITTFTEKGKDDED